MSDRERIRVGTDGDGADVSLPVVDVLTGRGLITGKSGSGKSNTASVVIEELLDAGFPVLICDTDGEYYGLKEEYELLHAGADEECDIQVSPEHAERLATLALEENVPIILDVSGYLDEEVADELLCETARHLFAKEKKLKTPFLLVVEEVHEYLPQKGSGGEAGKMLIKVGKRGRKHGLGLLGISQRPADVKKDFITQANWLVWHRLTWDNDTDVVKRVVGDEYATAAPDLDDGEAFLQTDWGPDVQRVQFRRKRTFDAGATPGLEDVQRPELKSVSDSLVDDLREITDERERERDRIAELEDELAAKRDRIEELEAEVERARDVSGAAERIAEALTDGVVAGEGDESTETATLDRWEGFSEEDAEDDPDTRPHAEAVTRLIDTQRERIRDLETRLDERERRSEAYRSRLRELQVALGDARDQIHDLRAENQRLRRGQEPEVERTDAESNAIVTVASDAAAEDDRADDSLDVGLESDSPDADPESDPLDIDPESNSLDVDRPETVDTRWPPAGEDPADLVRQDPIRTRIERAIRASQLSADHGWAVVDEIASGPPRRADDLAAAVGGRVQRVWTFLAELRSCEFVHRDAEGRYALDAGAMTDEIARADVVNEQFQELKSHAMRVD